MAGLLRVVAYLLGLLLLLVVVAAVVLPMVVDPNDYKDDIAAAVKAQTGRKLTMDGDLGLSVFPWLALQIGPTSLSNAPGFSSRPFAQVKQVSVRIKLLPLLHRKVEMDTVVLDGLQLSLEKNADGKTNWADLASAQAGKTTPATSGQESAAGKMTLAGFAIGGVKITDAGIRWDDQQNGAHYQLSGLSLRAGAIQPGATVPVKLAVQINSKEPRAEGPVTFNAQVALSDDSQTIRLSDARLKTALKGAGLPAGALDAQLGFDATLDLSAGNLQLPKLTAEALGLTIETHGEGKNLFTEPLFKADIKLKEFVPKEVIKALGQPLPKVSDTTVLARADADLKLEATNDSVKVSALSLHLDDSTIDGDLGVSHFAKPTIRFNLHLDDIDVDRYLPPQSKKAPPATPETAVVATTQLFPLETLRSLDINGRIKIDRLKVSQLKSSDLLMEIVAKAGLIRIHPAQAKLYQGSYDGDLTLDARGTQPRISMHEKLAGVRVGPLLKDVAGKDLLTGTTHAGANLTTAGQTPAALKKNLDGKVDFAFENGAVKGVDLAALIRQAQAVLKGQPAGGEKGGSKQTEFSELSGTANITRGVIHNRDLMLKSPLFRVQGEGDVDLPAEQLDYRLTAKIVGSLKGQGGKKLSDLKGLAIPVQISGSFEQPQYQVQLDTVITKSVEKKARKKLKKKLKKKFGNQLQQFKGLFQ